MYLEINKQKNKNGSIRTYLRLAETYRENGKVKKNVIKTFGRLDKLIENGQLEKIAAEFTKYLDKYTLVNPQLELFAESGKEYGTALFFGKILEKIGLKKALASCFDTEQTEMIYNCLLAMIIHKITDPGSKQACFDWTQSVCQPSFDELKQHQLYQTLDHLSENHYSLEQQLFDQRPRELFNQDVELVFYDTTSIYFHMKQPTETLKFGHSKDHRGDKVQLILALACDTDGYPIAHEVFPGSKADVSTIKSMFNSFKKRFSIKRVILLCDRGMISEPNLYFLEEEGIEYVIGAKMRNNNEIKSQVLQRGGRYTQIDNDLKAKEITVNNHRYVLILNQAERMHELSVQQDVLERLMKMEGLSTKKLIKHREIRRYLRPDIGKIQVNWDKMKQEQKYCGKWVLRTNVSLSKESIIKAYKNLWRIERDFRHLKGNLEIRPVYHWTESRIRGHIMMSVIALRVEVYWQRLKEKLGIELTRKQVINKLKGLQMLEVKLKEKSYLVRTECDKRVHRLINAVGGRLPQRVREK